MDTRKVEKTASLVIALSAVCLSLIGVDDWHSVGIYAGCSLRSRLLYPFFHANLFHATMNVWCLLSVVFIYDVSIWRLLLAFVVAATVPVGMLGMDAPTVGLSGVVFVLFGTLSFEVLRKRYYQMWMLFYLALGFLLPNTNALLHLYCYAVGFVISVLNKPIKVK